MPLEFPTVPLLVSPHWHHCHSSLGNSWLWKVADFPCLWSLSDAQEDCLGSSYWSSSIASLMLGVGSRSLRRRLQRKSFLIPWAHTVGSASQAKPGLARFYTILFPFLPHSALKSREGSCHGACKREHRRRQRTKRWFKILHQTSSLISHLLTLPTLVCIYLYGPLAICCILQTSQTQHQHLLCGAAAAFDVSSPWWFFPLAEILLWLCDIDSTLWAPRNCGCHSIWALAPHVSVGFLWQQRYQAIGVASPTAGGPNPCIQGRLLAHLPASCHASVCSAILAEGNSGRAPSTSFQQEVNKSQDV